MGGFHPPNSSFFSTFSLSAKKRPSLLSFKETQQDNLTTANTNNPSCFHSCGAIQSYVDHDSSLLHMIEAFGNNTI
jgi:hypothetical protein